MDNPIDLSRRILNRHPAPALPYTELHRLVSRELRGPAPDRGFLLRRIRLRSDLFRTLDPWRGPWSALARSRKAEAIASREALERAGLPIDSWILALPTGGAATRRGLEPLMRETLLRFGRTVDDGSVPALIRWILLLREERAVRKRMAGARS